jgi:3-hydroxybutyryl-CoA dehydratase
MKTTLLYSKEVHLDEKKVLAFAELTGDRNRIHLDAEYAATTKFKRPIVHGMLVSAFISPCLVEAFGDGTIYAGQSIQFMKPVFVGDLVLVEFTNLVAIKDKKVQSVMTKIYAIAEGVKAHEVITGQASFIPAKLLGK